MSDMIVCRGEGCPQAQRESCRRYTPDPDPQRQSVFTTAPWDGKTCLRFWPIEVPYVRGRRVTRWK